MPVIYRKAHDGTLYPVYSGASEVKEVHDWYMNHSKAYGYNRVQMSLLLTGHKLRPSSLMKRQEAAKASGKCCHFDPRTLKVGDRVASMALPGSAISGTIPATVNSQSGYTLTSGAIVRPVSHARPVGTTIVLCFAFALVTALFAYMALKKYLEKNDGAIQVAAPAPPRD
jgi:hypothetical protein